MTARILVVDGTATNRILLKVRLTSANYHVYLATGIAEARAMVSATVPDLVVMDLGNEPRGALALFDDLKRSLATRMTRIIAIGQNCGPDERLAALAAGADEVLSKPVNEILLLARIRSLLRERDADNELRLREDTSRALGLCDPPADYLRNARVAMIVPKSPLGVIRSRAVAKSLPGGCTVIEPHEALGPGDHKRGYDLFVIDASCIEADRASNEVFRLVTELRSRSETRHAAQLVILPKGSEGLAAMVLDLGANDLVTYEVGMRELAHRCRTLLARKRRNDRMRATLRNGLRAAVTDPLTGLYNRRYALSHMQHMAENASTRNRPFAVMVLDIDHFKAINDQWGHTAGDAILVEVSRRLAENARTHDLVARIGGEEFVIAMPDASVRVARMAATRLCRLIEEVPFALPGTSRAISVTVSIGITMGGDHDADVGIENLVGRADAALYAAKNAGRNTISFSASASAA
ncbi:diguanylate cyclase [Pelagovum pacificum]|uniref:diguanylate cyclase n=1 Tax=Pelagovum pacificum TaxID=2588711 RepID=A0A5C5GER8_9RHOB|nr:diguanylate cyclase [Pelagovum pacificum]QQA43652.1 diguanylate cyclase [Pelagovum pacificum]TNY33213.1 diguanylate cyclase [Pelagovum pacificum]